jgi:hypothetical protein
MVLAIMAMMGSASMMKLAVVAGVPKSLVGKALKDPAADIIRTRLGEYAEADILNTELEKTYTLLEKYTTALAGLQELRKEITKGFALFDRYIFAAEALKNRAEFGILAASEYLQKSHAVDRNAIKEKLLIYREKYEQICRARLTPDHAKRASLILFGTLLEYLEN